MQIDDAYSSGHPILFHFGICKCSFVETNNTQSYITPPIHDSLPFVETNDTKSYITPPIHDSLPYLTSYQIWLLTLIWHHIFISLSLIWLLTEFDITEYRFPYGICSGCGMLTGDAYSSWSCPSLGLASVLMLRPISPELVFFSGLLSMEHPSVLLFCLIDSSLFSEPLFWHDNSKDPHRFFPFTSIYHNCSVRNLQSLYKHHVIITLCFSVPDVRIGCLRRSTAKTRSTF